MKQPATKWGETQAVIRAILFDFGNVIAFFDHYRAVHRFATHTMVSADAMYQAIYEGDLEHQFESGTLTVDEFVARVMHLIDYQQGRTKFEREFEDIFTPNPSVIELIPRLRPRYKLCLASNTNPLHAAHIRAEFAEVLQQFDALGMSFQAGVRKPEAGFYHYCANLVGTPVSECLFLDDIEKNVAGAEAVGMSTIHYLPDTNLLARLAERGIELA